MNLKDAILSTISEMEEHEVAPSENLSYKKDPAPPFKINETTHNQVPLPIKKSEDNSSHIIEDRFLHDLRERILVLFEGFQSPNNVKIEAKVDLTLNFLEHLLAKIDTKLEKKQ